MFDRKNKKPRLIFIVEDNAFYAKTLKAFLSLKLNNETQIETFPVGELCLDNMNRRPDFVIMDYYLNSKFYDAANGLDMAKQVKSTSPATQVIVLSAQSSMDVAVDVVKQLDCNYVIKNESAYDKVSSIISSRYK